MRGSSNPLTSLTKRAVGFFVPAFLALLPACTRAHETNRDALVDDIGHELTLSAPAERVVSLSPAITEVLFAIGAGDRLVGRTQWDVYPPEAKRVPSVGEGLPPNVEVVVATRPDLVLFYAASANAAAIEQLDGIGIPTFSLRVDSLASVATIARQLGVLTGHSSEGEDLATRFRARLDSASQHVSGLRRTSVVILVWDNPPIVIGGGSFLSELVALAGGQNVFADIVSPSATVSIEAIAQRDPNLVLITGDSEPGFLTRSEWQAVSAVAADRIVLVSGSEFSWPSPRAFQAVAKLEESFAEYERRLNEP